MKKVLIIMLVLILSMGLIACQKSEIEEKAAVETVVEQESSIEQEPVVEKSITVEDIMSRSMEEAESLQNFTLEMILLQKTSVGGEELMNNNIAIMMDIIQEPLMIHEIVVIEAIPMEMELYLSEDAIYSIDSFNNQWTKAPQDSIQETVDATQAQANATEMLTHFQDYVDEFTLVDEDGNYKLSFEVSGDQYEDLIRDTLDSLFPEETMEEDVFETVEINAFEYSLTIDKDTFFPKEFILNTDLSIDVEDSQMNVVQLIKGSYSNINEVLIEIPADVIESAVEMGTNSY